VDRDGTIVAQPRDHGGFDGCSFSSLLKDVARIRREIDDTLVLAPTYAAALAAKGQMLTELPHYLGGDIEEGRRLLRLAVTLAPDDSRMRSMLVDSLESSP
jgi:hypothetical protein